MREKLVNKKVCVLYLSVYKYFYFPAEKETKRDRTDIESERRFNQLISETIVSDVVNNEEMISILK